MMSKFVSKEQFNFLENKHIMDAIRVPREVLHNIKVKKLKALVLNLDINKAYDCVSWAFLRLVLIHIRLSIEAVN